MQEVRRFKPSTVSQRFSVTAGFYRTCVIDGVLKHSPAEYVRRPAMQAESPTLGVHAPAVRGIAHRRPPVRQPERLRAGGHAGPAGPCGSLRPPARISVTLARSTGTGSAGKAARPSWSRCLRRPAGPSTAPRITLTPGRSCSTATARGWTGMQPLVGSGGPPRQPESEYVPAHVRHDHARARSCIRCIISRNA
jgi:hypothetical protein